MSKHMKVYVVLDLGDRQALGSCFSVYWLSEMNIF